MDGLYYRHDCGQCGQTVHDCLPMLVCPACKSPDVAVAFDEKKRAHELAKEVTT